MTRIAIKLLRYGLYLCPAAAHQINFSKLHVASKWVMDFVKSAPPPFRNLEEQAISMHTAYALSSGQGLFELWKSLYPRQSTSINITDAREVLDVLLRKSAPRETIMISTSCTLTIVTF